MFVPPQVPLTTSTSSISPQRRSIGQEGAGSPFARPMQPYTYQQPLPSPQSYGYNEQTYGAGLSRPSMYATPMVPEHGHRLRDRTGTQSSGQFNSSAGRTSGPGILPTPDPTIASCISDEDVAMQLIRLGDASNFSHGRTSASTLDDAFSGAADAASSTGATSDGEDFSEEDADLLPPEGLGSPLHPSGTGRRSYKRSDESMRNVGGSNTSDYDVEDGEPKDRFKNESDEDSPYKEFGPKAKKAKTRAASTTSTKSRGPKPGPQKQQKGARNSSTAGSRKAKVTPSNGNPKAPTSPQMVSPAPTRKTSTSSVNPQHSLAADEEDLSTKPRCQRCRKSKKGCDRQRPCGRCKDAGIGVEGCISEDEGNGRKGRYGRHMGVPVKKALDSVATTHEAQPAMAPVSVSSATVDKSKKRKR